MDKKYLNAIESITPPDGSVEKMMSAAMSAESDRKRGFKWYVAAGIAACLALALTVGGMAGIRPFTEDGFTLTAYAAEGGAEIGSELVRIDTLDVGASEYYRDENRDRYSLQAFCDFDVEVKGKNIESVEYRIINGEFLVEKGNKAFKQKMNPKGRTVELGTEEDHLGVKEFSYETFGSFSVDYNNQPKREADGSGEYRFARGPVMIGVRADEKDGEDIKKALKSYGGGADGGDVVAQPARLLYKRLFGRLEIVVTAHLKDGTSKSEGYVFSAEYTGKNGDLDLDIMVKRK